MTVREWAVYWQEKYDAPAVRRTSYEAHRYVLENHIIPSLGERELMELTVDMVEDFLAQRRTHGNRRNGGPLSEVTMRHIWRLLTCILDRAVEERLRQRELIALKWSDLDVKNRTLTVHGGRTVECGKLVEHGNKMRTICLPKFTVECLVHEHEKHLSNEAMFIHPGTLKPYSPQMIRLLHERVLERAELERAELERHCYEDGSRSMTAFIERALDFYLGYLGAQDTGIFLPPAIRSCIDRRLGTMEKRIAALLFKQAVELDMCERDSLELDEAYLRRKRAESINSVKRTNGQLRFEQIARDWENE